MASFLAYTVSCSQQCSAQFAVFKTATNNESLFSYPQLDVHFHSWSAIWLVLCQTHLLLGLLVAWRPVTIDFLLASLLLWRSLSCNRPIHPFISGSVLSAIITFLWGLTWPMSAMNSEAGTCSCGHPSLGMSKLGGSYRKCNWRKLVGGWGKGWAVAVRGPDLIAFHNISQHWGFEETRQWEEGVYETQMAGKGASVKDSE